MQSFSRHADVRTLLIYRDQVEDAQGAIADLVAERLPHGGKGTNRN